MVNDGGIQQLRHASISHNTVVNSGGYQILINDDDTVNPISNETIVNNGGAIYTMTVNNTNKTVELNGITTLNAGANLIFSDGRFANASIGEKGDSSTMPFDVNSIVQVNGGNFIINYNANTNNFGAASAGVGNIYTHSFNVPVYGNGNIFFGIGEKADASDGGNINQAYNKVEFAEINGNFAVNASYIGNCRNLLDKYEDILKVFGGNNNIYALNNGIDLGLYEYNLPKTEAVGVSSYSLVKTNKYASYVKAVPTIGTNTLITSRALNNSMHKRVGELMWQYDNDRAGFDFLIKDESNALNNFWIRSNIKNVKLDRSSSNDVKMDINVFITELGYDYMLYNSNYGRAYIGILGQFLSSKAELTPTSGAKTNTNIDGKSIGLYGMWLGKDGYFADIAVRQHFIDQDANTKDQMGNNLLEYKMKQDSTTLNFEMGREIVFGGNKSSIDYDNKLNSSKDNSAYTNNIRTLVNSVYFIIPKIQFDINHTRGDSIDASLGRITIDDTIGYTLSGGFIFGKRFDMNKIRGSKINDTLKDNVIAQLYFKADYIYEFGAEVKTNFAGVEQSIDNDGSKGEVGIGFNARFNNVFSLYIDLSYQFNNDYSEKGFVVGGRWAF